MWLQEPIVEDNTRGVRDEHPMKWLKRSTLPKAKECRQFLNENLSKLPEENQKQFYDALHTRYKSAYFELIVARTLQLLGAKIKIEVEQKDGKQPDFQAQFSSNTIIVEAVSPNFNPETGDAVKKRNPLYEIIESLAPEGWSVGICQLPEIGLSDSKKEFKKVISKLLNVKPPTNDSEKLSLTYECSTGDIELLLIPKKEKYPSVGWESPITTFVDTKERVRKAIESKKKQVRSASSPSFVAIQGSWLSDSLEDYDLAIYGYICAVTNEKGEFIDPIFIGDGVFATSRTEVPTFAGAIIFPEVGMKTIKNPVVYNHPRFNGALPDELLMLEQRYYENDGINSIKSIPAKDPDLFKNL